MSVPTASLMPFPVACFPFPDVGNKHWKLDYANVRIPISKPRPTAVAHRTRPRT
jgi:hypothetical protein